MNITKRGALLFLALQGLSYGSEMTLKEILMKVDSDNLNIKMQEYDVESSKKNLNKSLKNLVLPPIDFSATGDWEEMKDDGVGPKKVEMKVPLYSGGRVLNSYKSAKAGFEMSKKQKILTEVSVEEEAINTYFTLLNAEKQREYIGQSREALEKQRRRISTLYENGKIVPKAELLKIEADLEKNKLDFIKAGYLVEDTKQKLYKIMGMPLDSNLEFGDFVPEEFALGEKKKRFNLPTGEEKVRKDSTLSQMAHLELEKAEYAHNIAKADLYPEFYLKPKYTFRTDDDDEKGFVLELGFNWVFAWGATYDGVVQSRYQFEKAKIKFEETMRGLSLTTREKYRNMESLYAQSNIEKKRMEILKENLKLDTARYSNGLMSTFDYLNSLEEMKKSQESFYALERDLVFSIIQYENLFK